MSLRDLAAAAVIAGAAYALWRRGGLTLPGVPLTPPTAKIPASATPSGGSGSVGSQLEAFLRGRGVPPAAAKGSVAGAYAESRLDPNAVNPKSGAYGIGQWLGSRKAELFRRYGPRPNLAQQAEFLAWELLGGDHGGAAVLAQSTPAGALDAYIRRFMRPAAGAETTGDLARGARYLANG